MSVLVVFDFSLFPNLRQIFKEKLFFCSYCFQKTTLISLNFQDPQLFRDGLVHRELDGVYAEKLNVYLYF